MVPQRVFAVLIALSFILIAPRASAAISLCVEVRAPQTDLAGLRKLVQS